MKTPSQLYFVVLFLLLIPSVWGLAAPDFFPSHDGLLHLIRVASFHKALSEGEMIPRWAGDLAFGSGSPVLIFYGFLPNLLASVTHFLGVDFVDSVKLWLSFSLVGSGLFFFLWGRRIFGNLPATVGAVLYVWAPYRLVDVYIRAAYPESLAFIFAPLVLWSGEELVDRPGKNKLIFFALSVAGLVLSHNVLAVLFLGGAGWYFCLELLVKGARQRLLWLAGGTVVALGLTAFFWLPAITESSWVKLGLLNLSAINRLNLSPPARLLYSPWGWRAPPGPRPMSVQLGAANWLVILGVMLALLKRIPMVFGRTRDKVRGFGEAVGWRGNRILIGFLPLAAISIYLTTRLSAQLWHLFPPLDWVLYPWRFLSSAVWSCAILACWLLARVPERLRVGLAGLLLILVGSFGILHARPFGTLAVSDRQLVNARDSADVWGEFLPRSADLATFYRCRQQGCEIQDWQLPREVILKAQVRRTNLRSLNYEAAQGFGLVANVNYYPGWEAWLDSRRITLSVTTNGLMRLDVPPGRHSLVLHFGETPLRRAADAISVVAVSLLVFAGVQSLIQKYVFQSQPRVGVGQKTPVKVKKVADLNS